MSKHLGSYEKKAPPWRFERKGCKIVADHHSGQTIAVLHIAWWDDEEIIAVGNTLAAAPDLLEALKGLLKHYDPERNVIDVDPEPSCFECTVGTIPDHLNKGLCAHHRAIASIAASEAKS